MKKDKKQLYGKILVGFFIVVAVCTIISRAADAMTIPKVTVQRAEKGRITYVLNGNGVIEAVTKSTQLLPEGFLVESCLSDKTSVEAGEVLIQLQMEQLEKKKEELETALEQAELQLEQAELGQTEEAWVPAEEEAQRNVNQAQAEYDQAVAEKQQAQENYNQNMTDLNAESEDYLAKKAELEAGLAAAEERFDAAATGLSQAQQVLEAAKKSDDVIRQNNAKAQQAAGYTVESARLNVDAAEKSLQEAEELIAQEGKICAEEKGIFLNTTVTAGMITTGSEFVSIGTGGFTFSAEVPKEAGEKLAVGDSIFVQIPGQKGIESSLAQITVGKSQKEGTEEEVVLLKSTFLENAEISGEYASFSIQKSSEEEYQMILPLTAIRQDSKGYYCLGIRSQDSILGEEVKAERINVTLLDKDDTQAAIEGAIQPETKIIITSEKDVLTGDRVRITE